MSGEGGFSAEVVSLSWDFSREKRTICLRILKRKSSLKRRGFPL